MIFKVSSSLDSADEGTLRSAFIHKTEDVVVELTQDINLTVSQPFTFFHPPKSFILKTNGFKCIITGAGFVFKDMNYVSVSGVTFYNFTGDGIQLNNVKKYSVRNNTFIGHTSTTDEAVSSVKGSGSEGGEICWNLFSKVNKGILCGTGDAGDEVLDVKQNVFIHHNWFYDFERRAPYCRCGTFYVYNNIFENWKFKGDQTFCIWAEDNAKLILLNNSFKQSQYNMWDGFPKRQMSWFTKRPWCMDQGSIARFGGNIHTYGNDKNRAWIKIEGSDYYGPIFFPEYETMSTTMEPNIQAKAGSGLLL